jgi:hypothetical protein
LVDANSLLQRLSLLVFPVLVIASVACFTDPTETATEVAQLPPTSTVVIDDSPSPVLPTRVPTTTPVPDKSIPTQTPIAKSTSTTQPLPNIVKSPVPTRLPVSPTSTATPNPSPVDPTVKISDPTATAVTPSATPSPVTASPTLQASPTPTPTPTATPVVPTVDPGSPQPVLPTSTPVPTPVPVSDSRFALIVGGRDNPEAAYFADALGVAWYMDYGAGPSVSSGLNKLRAIMLEPDFHPYSDAEIISMVESAPGSYYQLGNEPNIFGDAVHLPAGYAEALNYYVTRIKAADPTAKIVGPNILNFDFTCIGCGGYTSGHTWLEQMRHSYLTNYGSEPPIDIWAIHQYPLDWFNFPTVNDAILTQDLDAFRAYIDTLPGQSGSVIWITEFGLHWGFEKLKFVNDETKLPCNQSTGGRCMPAPDGEYMTSAVIQYLDRLTSYYKWNSSRLNLERWFLWRHNWSFGPNPSGTNGLTLFDSFHEGGALTAVGTAYRNLIFGG